jgi:RNA polymerase sigma-70 factor (ECF subfamily)
MRTRETVLLKRAQAYEEQAIAELYDHYAPHIYSYLYRRVHDAQLAEDLTSDVFVRVLQALQSEQFWHTSFRAWLYRIAHNQVIDHYRQQTRQQTQMPQFPIEEHLETADIEENGSNPADDLDARHDARDVVYGLEAALNQLTPEQQQVLVLRFGEQMKIQEVAEVMHKTNGAIEALQHRALAALRRMLDPGKV